MRGHDIQDRERPDPVSLVEREPVRYSCPTVVADHMGTFDVECVEKFHDVGSHATFGVPALGLVAEPVAAQIGGDDPIGVWQERGELIPAG